MDGVYFSIRKIKDVIDLKLQLEKGESSLMWYYMIRIPDEAVSQLVSETHKRVMCSLEGKVTFHAALLPDGAGGHFIIINKARRDKIGLVQGQVINVSLEPDTSEFGADMSEELAEVLNQDDVAKKHFMELTPGKQRTLIYWSDNVKSSDIKIRRALVMCNHLVDQAGKIDFKRLNEEMKQANRMARRA